MNPLTDMMVPDQDLRKVPLFSSLIRLRAAARSLPKVTHHSVEELLEAIFQDRLEDGQLDECPLTLEEVAKIKKSFLKRHSICSIVVWNIPMMNPIQRNRKISSRCPMFLRGVEK